MVTRREILRGAVASAFIRFTKEGATEAMDQRISIVTLGVKDLAISKRFYLDGLGWKPVFENKEIIFFQAGGMIFALFLPGYWTSSHAAQHVIVAVFYAAGLVCIAAIRSRHRFDYLDGAYSLVEAFLWLGIYLAVNLKLSSLNLPPHGWGGGTRAASEFARPFYWTTWVLIWCLPPAVLARGVRQKDRFVLAVGAIAAIMTLVSNKPYLGWQRHSWDPMLLGMLLSGVALFLRRWLARGPGGIRHGFTAARLSGKDKHWMNVSSAVLGLGSPQSIAPPQTSSPDFRFGGGASGGGGAEGDF